MVKHSPELAAGSSAGERAAFNCHVVGLFRTWSAATVGDDLIQQMCQPGDYFGMLGKQVVRFGEVGAQIVELGIGQALCLLAAWRGVTLRPSDDMPLSNALVSVVESSRHRRSGVLSGRELGFNRARIGEYFNRHSARCLTSSAPSSCLSGPAVCHATDRMRSTEAMFVLRTLA